MNKYLKFLVIPAIILGGGNILNSNICYGMNARDITRNYFDDNFRGPSFNSQIIYKNSKPIKLNNQEVLKCFNNVQNISQSDYNLLNHLLVVMYRIADGLNSNRISTTNKINLPFTIEIYNDRNPNELNDMQDIRTQSKLATVIPTNVLKSMVLDLQLMQYKLNPNKYNNKLPSIPENSTTTFVQAMYYTANSIVELTKDLIYAVNDHLENFRLNNNDFSTTQSKTVQSNYLRNEIFKPCIDALESVIQMINAEWQTKTSLLKFNKLNYDKTDTLEEFLIEPSLTRGKNLLNRIRTLYHL